MTEKKVKAASPGGFRDYAPSEMIARLKMLETIRNIYERFGFDPLDTHAVELLEVLVGGDPNFDKMIFETMRRRGQATGGREQQGTALRFDLTVPLARYVTANSSNLPKPFKRWQVGRVWRGEKPQAGRYREFLQCDIDTVGSSSPLADAEIVWVIYETLDALGVERFQIRINNRKVLNGLSALAGFAAEKLTDVLRVIDKLDKIGMDAILVELTNPQKPVMSRDEYMKMSTQERQAYDNTEYGLGLSSNAAAVIQQFLKIKGSVDEVLAQISALAGEDGVMHDGAEELSAITSYLRSVGLPDSAWTIDLSVARGLGYYTGPVFETQLLDLPNFGSVFSGGRFDGLVGRFGHSSIPATGASIGVDRLFAALQELGQMKQLKKTVVEALVMILDPSRMEAYLAMLGELRQAKINAAIWLGDDSAFGAQLKYAVGQGIPVVVICGEDEFAAGTVTVKDMDARRQETHPRKELAKAVRSILDKKRG